MEISPHVPICTVVRIFIPCLFILAICWVGTLHNNYAKLNQKLNKELRKSDSSLAKKLFYQSELEKFRRKLFDYKDDKDDAERLLKKVRSDLELTIGRCSEVDIENSSLKLANRNAMRLAKVNKDSIASLTQQFNQLVNERQTLFLEVDSLTNSNNELIREIQLLQKTKSGNSEMEYSIAPMKMDSCVAVRSDSVGSSSE